MGTVHAKAPAEPEPSGVKASTVPGEKKKDAFINFERIPVRVQRVVVDGLTRTKDDVIIKEIKPLLNAKSFNELVLLSYNAKVKMERLGLFKNVVIAIDVSKDKRENGYEVMFEVSEFRRVRSGGIHTEISNNDGNLILGLQMPNIFGRGEKFDLHYIIGTKRTHGYKAYMKKPLNNNPDVFLGATASQSHTEYPWSGFKQTDRGVAFDLTFPSIFGSHNLQWEGVWRDLRALSRETSFSVREQAGHSLKSSLKHMFAIDSRDDRILPTCGTLWQTCQEYAGVGGNVEYAKQDGTFQWNTSLPWDTIFQISLAGGIMRPLDPKGNVSISDRFFLGGPLTLRGFNLNGCGPHSHENALGAEAYWLAAAHLYSPLPFRPGKGRFGDHFKTHFFINAGNLGDLDFYDLRGSVRHIADSMRWSYGFGLVLYMGGMARLELNYVIPMRVQKGDKANPGLQFGIGIQFL